MRRPYREPLKLARILWWTGVLRLYADGDGWSPAFRWWHPLTWILWIGFLPVCGIVGEPIGKVVPLHLEREFRDTLRAHPKNRVLWTPWQARRAKKEARLLQNGSAWECLLWARDVPGADIVALQNRILQIGDGYDCYVLAHDVPEADKKALEQRVLQIGTVLDCILFARDIVGADLDALRARVQQIGDADDDRAFVRMVPSAEFLAFVSDSENLRKTYEAVARAAMAARSLSSKPREAP